MTTSNKSGDLTAILSLYVDLVVSHEDGLIQVLGTNVSPLDHSNLKNSLIVWTYYFDIFLAMHKGKKLSPEFLANLSLRVLGSAGFASSSSHLYEKVRKHFISEDLLLAWTECILQIQDKINIEDQSFEYLEEMFRRYGKSVATMLPVANGV